MVSYLKVKKFSLIWDLKFFLKSAHVKEHFLIHTQVFRSHWKFCLRLITRSLDKFTDWFQSTNHKNFYIKSRIYNILETLSAYIFLLYFCSHPFNYNSLLSHLQKSLVLQLDSKYYIQVMNMSKRFLTKYCFSSGTIK